MEGLIKLQGSVLNCVLAEVAWTALLTIDTHSYSALRCSPRAKLTSMGKKNPTTKMPTPAQ